MASLSGRRSARPSCLHGDPAATATWAIATQLAARCDADQTGNALRCRGRRRLRVVAEVGREPALGLGDREALPAGVVGDLVAPDAADGEVPRLRMGQVDAAHA